MPKFLAVYTIQAEAVARFRAQPKETQDATDAAGLAAWKDWEQRNAAMLRSPSSMVGKTLRVTTTGTAPAVNTICGYLVVEAETIEAAAGIFEDHPHITIFPGEGIDIMPFLTGPE